MSKYDPGASVTSTVPGAWVAALWCRPGSLPNGPMPALAGTSVRATLTAGAPRTC